jgi:NAD(P)-dependent dehydrogenase (short-subunit alcohol dehydrogenase family)
LALVLRSVSRKKTRTCFITGRRQSQLDAAVAAIGGEAAAIQGDTTSLANLDRIFAEIQAQAGRIDVLAVNAGIYEFGTLGEISEEHFDRTFNTNVRGLLFTVQKALPLLTRGSSVILTSSMVSITGFAACSVYNASKAAVRSFARTWIVDLKGAPHPRQRVEPRIHGHPRPLAFHDG